MEGVVAASPRRTSGITILIHYGPLLETNANPLNHDNHSHCFNDRAKHHFSISSINQGVNPVPTTGP